MKKIYAIIKHPDENVGNIKEVDNTLKAFQEIVGGYIQAVPLATDLAIICNGEGRLQGLPDNCDVAGINFVGTIMAVGVKGDEFADVPIGLDTWKEYWIGGYGYGQEVR